MNCTEENFLKCVKNHTIEVLNTDGGDRRHIRCSNNGSFNGKFDLITWPGFLCITGDYGTYVFERLPDMFEFFRSSPLDDGLNINPRYWGEKLQSISVNDGYRKFSIELFTERVTEYFNDYWEDMENSCIKIECWDDVKNNVLSEAEEGETYAYSAVNNYSYELSDGEYFRFDDFFDVGSTEEYTHHYIWCLYAIVWSIKQYDNSKFGENNDSKK